MFTINRVEIEGFWGKYKISTDFHSDINIFIGKNGTGKTTFINLLSAVLKGDLKSLLLHDFQKITIILSDEDSKNRTISVTKIESPETSLQNINYKIGTRSYKFTVSARDIDMLARNLRRRTMMSDSLVELEHEISKLVNISSLTVHRITFEYTEDDYRVGRRPDFIVPPIDQRLEELTQRLKGYQLTLAKQANEISSRLQKEVLASILFNPDFDKFLYNESQIDLGKVKQELSRAYKELGAFDSSTPKKIDGHISALKRSLENILESRTSQSKPLRIDDIMPMSLLRRTQHIIELSLAAEQEKQKVFELIDLFTQTIKSFMVDKDITMTPSGDLQITKEQKIINIPALSSGEKQLLILLIETLLQKNAPFIFLADEPELSLHIDWQSKIIPSIKKLNTAAQVIVATHSPEIAAGGQDKVIDMEDILHG